jgi:CRISPR-associated endonuclease/helicase Cas3
MVVCRRHDGTLATVPWLAEGGDLTVTEDAPPPWRVATAVASCGLRLPREFSGRVLDDAIGELEATLFPAWQTRESPLLAGELILVLDPDLRARLAGRDLSYSPADGLKVRRAR